MEEKTHWNEAAIRKVLTELDKKTGLNGAECLICFDRCKGHIGMYYSSEKKFSFSRYYYDDPKWSDESAIETIRHEYAHYMDDVLFGNVGHGKTWKRCCVAVGAMPFRCASEKITEYYRHKHEKEAALAEYYAIYRPGVCLEHPKYGRGTILEVTGEAAARYIAVEFPAVGRKLLTLAWADENCRMLK